MKEYSENYGNENVHSLFVIKILTLCMMRARAGSIIQVAVARDKFVSAKIGEAFFLLATFVGT